MYKNLIKTYTGCTDNEVDSIEDIMRNDIFHSTLDWQSPKQFRDGAREAYGIHKAIQELKAVHGEQWYNHV
jgi:hypothetical protein